MRYCKIQRHDYVGVIHTKQYFYASACGWTSVDVCRRHGIRLLLLALSYIYRARFSSLKQVSHNFPFQCRFILFYHAPRRPSLGFFVSYGYLPSLLYSPFTVSPSLSCNVFFLALLSCSWSTGFPSFRLFLSCFCPQLFSCDCG